MTLSEEGPSTPLTVSSTSGTIDYCEDNDDVIGCAPRDPGPKGSSCVGELLGAFDSDIFEERKATGTDADAGAGLEAAAVCAFEVGDAGNFGENGDGGGDPARAIAAIEGDPEAFGGPSLAAAPDDLDCAAVQVSFESASASGLTVPESMAESDGAAVSRDTGFPVREALEGSGRLLGAMSKRSVFRQTSTNLLLLAAVHGDSEGEGASEGEGGGPRSTSAASADDERRRSVGAAASSPSPAILPARYPVHPAAPTTYNDGKDPVDEEQLAISSNHLLPQVQSAEGLRGQPRSSLTGEITPLPTREDAETCVRPPGPSRTKDLEPCPSSSIGVTAPNPMPHPQRQPQLQSMLFSPSTNESSNSHKNEDIVGRDEDSHSLVNDNDNNGEKNDNISAIPAVGGMTAKDVEPCALATGGEGPDPLTPPPPPPPPPQRSPLEGSGTLEDEAKYVPRPFGMGRELHFPTRSVGRREEGLSIKTGAFGRDDPSMQSGVKSVGDRVTEAAEVGDLQALEAFLDRGGDIETRDSRLGATMLGWATRRGHLEVIRFLLGKGAKVMARDGKLRTPLHRACTGCHDDVVKVLLENGADPNARDKTGRSPLHRAARWGSPACGLLLLDAGADIEARDEEMARTPLHYASRSGGVVTTLMLLDNGANVNAKTAVGNTPLHLVCDRGLVENAKLLLEWGADPAVANTAGAIPTEAAAPWVEDSVKAHLKEIFAKHAESAEDEAASRTRLPTVVRPRPDGAAEVEEVMFESIRSRRSSRTDYSRSRSGVRSTRDIFGELWLTTSNCGSEAHLGFGESGLDDPGLEEGEWEWEEFRTRSRRGLGSIRKQESLRLARAKKKQRQRLGASGCHCTVQ